MYPIDSILYNSGNRDLFDVFFTQSGTPTFVTVEGLSYAGIGSTGYFLDDTFTVSKGTGNSIQCSYKSGGVLYVNFSYTRWSTQLQLGPRSLSDTASGVFQDSTIPPDARLTYHVVVDGKINDSLVSNDLSQLYIVRSSGGRTVDSNFSVWFDTLVQCPEVPSPGIYYARLSFIPDTLVLVPGNSIVNFYFNIQRYFLLTDQQGDTVRNMPFVIYHASLIRIKDSLIDREISDDSGRIPIDPRIYHFGDSVRFEYFVGDVSSPNRGTSGTPAYSINLDNLRYDSIGTVLLDTVSHDGLQPIHISHAFIELNAVISIEWPTQHDFIDTLESDIRKLSNYLYDVYDGQVQIKNIEIWDSALGWTSSDVQFYTTTEQWPLVMNDYLILDKHVKMPRRWTGSQSPHGRSYLADTNWLNNAYLNGENYRTVGHEMGHYYFGFLDEYVWIFGNRHADSDLGYMQSQYSGDGPFCSELSSKSRYVQLGNPYTLQWGVFGESCWDKFAPQINKVIHAKTTINCDVLTPEDRMNKGQLRTGFIYLPGPNDESYNPNSYWFGGAQYDVGSNVSFTTFISSGTSKSILYHFSLPSAGTSHVGAATVQLKHPASNRTLDEGMSDTSGNFLVIGAYTGDQVIVSASDRGIFPPRWAVLDSTLTVPKIIQTKNKTLSSESVVEVAMKYANGSYSFLPQCSWEPDGSIELGLTYAVPFEKTPTLTLLEPGNDSSGLAMNFDNTTKSYSTQISSSNHLSHLLINALDSSGNDLPILLGCSQEDSVLLVSSSNGQVQLLIDSSNALNVERFACVSSSYPCPMNGLPADAENLGSIHAISLFPSGSSLQGNNQLTINYGDSALFHSQGDIQIFKWNFSAGQWTPLGGTLDSSGGFLSISTPISSDGIYGVFAVTPNSTVTLEPNANGRVIISPNPSMSTVTVESTSTQILHVTATNVLGNPVLDFENTDRLNHIIFNVTSLPYGTYFIYVTTPEGEIIQKFIKE